MSSQEIKMDFFEIGDKTSLVCADSNTAEVIRATLRELGFKVHTAESGEAGVERMRYTQYNCIVIQEDFAGSSPRANAVLDYLGPLPMAQRRYSFVCLIGPSFQTMDAMQAFAESVHLVMNPGDLPNLTAILKKGIAEFDGRYRVYRETFAAQGER